MTDMAALAETIAYDLMGTGDSLEVALERREAEGAELNSDFCARLDSLVFCCTTCDWWCEISEMAGDWTCDDCEDRDEDD